MLLLILPRFLYLDNTIFLSHLYGDRKKEYLKLKGVENPEIKNPNGFWSTSSFGGSRKSYLNYYAKGIGKEFELEVDEGFEMNPWVGVEKETLENFKNWLTKECEADENWLKSIDWDNLLRYNQGDAFFANHLDTEIPASKIEEPTTPIFQQILKGN